MQTQKQTDKSPGHMFLTPFGLNVGLKAFCIYNQETVIPNTLLCFKNNKILHIKKEEYITISTVFQLKQCKESKYLLKNAYL